VFEEVFCWYTELLVELKHCFKHFYYLWRAFREALAQCGSFSLWADLLGIFNGSFIGKEWEIVSIQLTQLVEYFDELVIFTNSGSISVAWVIVTLTWRDWEAARAWEEDSFVNFSTTLSYISVGERQALSKDASCTPHVRLGAVVAFSEDELWRAIPTWGDVRWKLSVLLLSWFSSFVQNIRNLFPIKFI